MYQGKPSQLAQELERIVAEETGTLVWDLNPDLSDRAGISDAELMRIKMRINDLFLVGSPQLVSIAPKPKEKRLMEALGAIGELELSPAQGAAAR